MNKVLILGSNGYIGSRLYEKLISLEVEVWGIDSFRRKDDKLIRNEKYNIEVSYQNLSDEMLSKFDDVVWLAGHSNVPESLADPVGAFKNNTIDMISFVSRLSKNQRFIYASSSSIYSGYRNKLAKETDPSYLPINTYDFSKVTFDAYVNSHNVSAIGLRFGTVNGYSRRLRKELMINSMVRSAVMNGVVNLANPKAHRPILALSDLVDGIYTILCSDVRTGFFNMANFNINIGVLAELIADHFSVPINRMPDTKSFDFAIDASLFEKTFDFEFKQKVLDIVDELVEGGACDDK
jgi:nucleoside-diphosphate-sugar epimerase